MAVISFDPARKITFYFRCARDGSKTLSFFDINGASKDVSGYSFEVDVKAREGSSVSVLTLANADLSRPATHQVTIPVTATNTNVAPNTYFLEINVTLPDDSLHTWITGPAIFHNGEFDGVTETTSLTIDETSGALTVTINDTVSPVAASQSEVNTGTDTSGFVNPATLANKDASAVALTDGASIALTKEKHTLTTSEAAITFTNTFTGDGIVMEVTLNATSSTFTFPAGYLCMANGTASGDNTLSLSGTSGDKYVIVILKFGSQYYVSSNNLGQ